VGDVDVHRAQGPVHRARGKSSFCVGPKDGVSERDGSPLRDDLLNPVSTWSFFHVVRVRRCDPSDASTHYTVLRCGAPRRRSLDATPVLWPLRRGYARAADWTGEQAATE
jgi:hypothetical protein